MLNNESLKACVSITLLSAILLGSTKVVQLAVNELVIGSSPILAANLEGSVKVTKRA